MSFNFPDLLSKVVNSQPNPPGADNTSIVPDEVILRVFANFSFRDLRQCELVSKRWSCLINHVSLWNILAERVGLPCFKDVVSLASKKQIRSIPLLDWHQQVGTENELVAFLENFCREMVPNQPYHIRFEADENCYLDVYVQKGGLAERVYTQDMAKHEKLIHCKLMIKKPSELLTPWIVKNLNGADWSVGPGSFSSNDWIKTTGSFYGYTYKESEKFCMSLSSSIEKTLKNSLSESIPSKLEGLSSFFRKLFN